MSKCHKIISGLHFSEWFPLVAILVVAVLGDILVHQYTFPFHPLIFKCLMDSGTHFALAALAWIFMDNTALTKKKEMLLPLLCGVLSSMIDLDHFIAAGSLNLEGAVSLQKRPIFHCTTIFLCSSLVIGLLSLFRQSQVLWNAAWILLTAVVTHHWRDGYRRGIWFCPFEPTPPFPYSIYLLGIMIVMPISLKISFKMLSPSFMKSQFPYNPLSSVI